LESEFVEVEMAMAAVENLIGQVLAAEKIIDFGCWEGTLGAHFPGLRVVVGRGTFCFAVNDYLSLVAYFGSVGVSHPENCL
jgi:hypothetical protein